MQKSSFEFGLYIYLAFQAIKLKFSKGLMEKLLL